MTYRSNRRSGEPVATSGSRSRSTVWDRIANPIWASGHGAALQAGHMTAIEPPVKISSRLLNLRGRPHMVAGFSGPPTLPESRRRAGSSASAPGSGRNQFSGGPEWLEAAVGKRFRRNWVSHCLSNLSCRIFRRPAWAGAEAGFVEDLQLCFAIPLSGLPVAGTADRQGWRRSSRDPLHPHL